MSAKIRSGLCCFGAANGNATHFYCRLSNTNWDALPGFTAGADAAIKLGIIPNHGDFGHRIGAIADQRCAFDRRTNLAIFDKIGLGRCKDKFARGNINLSAAPKFTA